MSSASRIIFNISPRCDTAASSRRSLLSFCSRASPSTPLAARNPLPLRRADRIEQQPALFQKQRRRFRELRLLRRHIRKPPLHLGHLPRCTMPPLFPGFHLVADRLPAPRPLCPLADQRLHHSARFRRRSAFSICHQLRLLQGFLQVRLLGEFRKLRQSTIAPQC
jgi:hypothetical protein